MFKDYIAYLRDNPRGFWFKRKFYGWGWVPVKKEGWIAVLTFVAILLINGLYLSYKASNNSPDILDLTIFLTIMIISIIILITICYKKGEKPKWSWGK